jgi:hypothetical protein
VFGDLFQACFACVNKATQTMPTAIITTKDLEKFKREILREIRQLLTQRQPNPEQRWIKYYQLKTILPLSQGTLYAMRLNGTLPFARIGGVILYDIKDILKMMQDLKERSAKTQSEKSAAPTKRLDA